MRDRRRYSRQRPGSPIIYAVSGTLSSTTLTGAEGTRGLNDALLHGAPLADGRLFSV